MTGPINAARSNPGPTPEVGMGATLLYWTDRRAATVVRVVSPRCIEVQADHSKRTDKNGMSECQEYEFTPNPDAPVVRFTLRRNGRWIRKGDPMRGGEALALGYRGEYYDYSF